MLLRTHLFLWIGFATVACATPTRKSTELYFPPCSYICLNVRCSECQCRARDAITSCLKTSICSPRDTSRIELTLNEVCGSRVHELKLRDHQSSTLHNMAHPTATTSSSVKQYDTISNSSSSSSTSTSTSTSMIWSTKTAMPSITAQPSPPNVYVAQDQQPPPKKTQISASLSTGSIAGITIGATSALLAIIMFLVRTFQYQDKLEERVMEAERGSRPSAPRWPRYTGGGSNGAGLTSFSELDEKREFTSELEAATQVQEKYENHNMVGAEREKSTVTPSQVREIKMVYELYGDGGDKPEENSRRDSNRTESSVHLDEDDWHDHEHERKSVHEGF